MIRICEKQVWLSALAFCRFIRKTVLHLSDWRLFLSELSLERRRRISSLTCGKKAPMTTLDLTGQSNVTWGGNSPEAVSGRSSASTGPGQEHGPDQRNPLGGVLERLGGNSSPRIIRRDALSYWLLSTGEREIVRQDILGKVTMNSA